MNINEAIEKVKNAVAFSFNDILTEQKVDVVYKSEVLDIINQIDEPQIVTIPKFVADWIEYCKKNGLTLMGSFDPVSEHGIGLAETFKGSVLNCTFWASHNQEIFARAWLDGYTLEKEKLYTVEIPNPNAKYSRIVLQRLKENTLHLQECTNENWKTYRMNNLTESEIKQDFEWAWDAGFAKEVE